MEIEMTLLSDAIFGSGMSETGGADISVLTDQDGFPYYRGGTFKGVFREALEQYLDWSLAGEEKEKILTRLLGSAGDDSDREDKLIFSDLQITEKVRRLVLEEMAGLPAEAVTGCMTHQRTFTRITEDGTAEAGSLRSARCVNQGLCFYGTIYCRKEDAALVEDVLSMIKWIGTMRNRGFGKVKIKRREGVA